MSEPTAEERIRAELAKTENRLRPWFNDTIETPAADVIELAEEFNFERPERDEDESDEDYAERVADEAATFVQELRDDEGKLNEQFIGADVSVTMTLRLDISTGGPADYVTADYDPSDGAISDVRYHFAPWFDHADVEVDSDSPLYLAMARFASGFDGLTVEEIAKRG